MYPHGQQQVSSVMNADRAMKLPGLKYDVFLLSVSLIRTTPSPAREGYKCESFLMVLGGKLLPYIPWEKLACLLNCYTAIADFGNPWEIGLCIYILMTSDRTFIQIWNYIIVYWNDL